MTSPWPYTGKAVPRSKPMVSSAAPQRPARVVADSVTISTPTRSNDKDAQAKAGAQDNTAVKGSKAQPTQGGTPRRLWPAAVDSTDRQYETTAASTPGRIMAKRTSLATTDRLQDTAKTSRTTARTTHDRITHERTRALSQTAASNRRNNADIQMDESDAGTIKEKGNKLVTRTFELAKSTGLVVSSMVLLKELLLPKMNVYMPNIIICAKTLLMYLRAATRRSVEHAARLVGAYPKIASAYAMVILAASATKMINE